MKLKKIFQISILKTLRFNYHYFGLKGVIHFYALIAKGVQFKKLKGNIELKNKKFNAIEIGFSALGTENDSTYKGTLELEGTLYVDGIVRLYRGCSLAIHKDAKVELGNLDVTGNTKIISNKHIKIGTNSIISWGGYIMDYDAHEILIDNVKSNEDKEIIIGEHCWIGMNVLILKGSKIPNNCIVAAGSTITKQLENENCVYFNNKIIKENITWVK